jgi:Ca2+-binding RTX toxin-like protein
LLRGSPAIDQGNSFGEPTDQRGEERPSDFGAITNATGGDGSDIGAFEVQSPLTVAAGGSCPSFTRAQGTINLSVTDANASLSATSSNQALVPDASITSGGSGENRTMAVRAVEDKSGTAKITLTVSNDPLGHATQIITITVGTNKANAISGTSATDMIFGRGSEDTLKGLEGNDLLCRSKGGDILNGGEGKDTVLGGPDRDRLYGGTGDDRLNGGINDDRLTGGVGADSFSGGPGKDVATDFDASEGDTKDSTIP